MSSTEKKYLWHRYSCNINAYRYLVKRICIIKNYNTLSLDLYDYRDDTIAKYHLKVAFESYCKQARDEEISERELAAINFCDENSLYYVMPAIFKFPKPFNNHNWYSFCPPDVLHTILGGCMKDWIFYTAVIIREIGTQNPSNNFDI